MRALVAQRRGCFESRTLCHTEAELNTGRGHVLAPKILLGQHLSHSTPCRLPGGPCPARLPSQPCSQTAMPCTPALATLLTNSHALHACPCNPAHKQPCPARLPSQPCSQTAMPCTPALATLLTNSHALHACPRNPAHKQPCPVRLPSQPCTHTAMPCTPAQPCPRNPAHKQQCSCTAALQPPHSLLPLPIRGTTQPFVRFQRSGGRGPCCSLPCHSPAP